MTNPYKVLRVKADADAVQIEEAYHRLRKLVAYGSAGTDVTERGITAAYEMLSDPRSRARVDRMLAQDRGRQQQASRRGPLRTLLERLRLI